jgi:hypothetical protein
VHTSHYESAKIHHDGDVEGCMYLVDAAGVEVVTTLQTLLDAMLEQAAGALVTITGPDAAVHDRFSVTRPSFDSIAPGPWTTKTVQVARADLEAFLVYAKTNELERAVVDLGLADAPYEATMAQLDVAIAAVKALLPVKD